MTNKKVAILNFPIEKVGGIDTYNRNLTKGLKELGYDVENCLISTNTKRLPDKPKFDKIFGFEQDKWLNELEEYYDGCDILIFSVPCPHLLKGYKSEVWKNVYESITPGKKVLAVMHDKYLPKYYPWFREVAEKHEVKFILPKEAFKNVLMDVKVMKKVIPMPYETKEVDVEKILENKQDILIDANNYKSVKRKHLILDVVTKIPMKIIFYGEHSTLEFFNIKSHKNFNLIEDKGWKTPEEVFKDMLISKISTDFIWYRDINGFTEYVQLESANALCVPISFMSSCPAYGLKTIVIKNILELPNIVEDIKNNFEKYKPMLLENLKLIKRLKCSRIAQNIVDFANESYEVAKIHNWW